MNTVYIGQAELSMHPRIASICAFVGHMFRSRSKQTAACRLQVFNMFVVTHWPLPNWLNRITVGPFRFAFRGACSDMTTEHEQNRQRWEDTLCSHSRRGLDRPAGCLGVHVRQRWVLISFFHVDLSHVFGYMAECLVYQSWPHRRVGKNRIDKEYALDSTFTTLQSQPKHWIRMVLDNFACFPLRFWFLRGGWLLHQLHYRNQRISDDKCWGGFKQKTITIYMILHA